MMKYRANKQHGLSMSGFLMVVVVLVFAAIFGMKIIPAYMESTQIQHVFDAIVSDPEMKNAKVGDIRTSYVRRASIDNITVVKAEDIEVEKSQDGLSLSASYSVKIPMGGNASLVLDFNIRSPK